MIANECRDLRIKILNQQNLVYLVISCFVKGKLLNIETHVGTNSYLLADVNAHTDH